MEVLISIIRPLGNVVARYVFSNKQVEEDSILSDALGGALSLLLITFFVWAIVQVAG